MWDVRKFQRLNIFHGSKKSIGLCAQNQIKKLQVHTQYRQRMLFTNLLGLARIISSWEYAESQHPARHLDLFWIFPQVLFNPKIKHFKKILNQSIEMSAKFWIKDICNNKVSDIMIPRSKCSNHPSNIKKFDKGGFASQV